MGADGGNCETPGEPDWVAYRERVRDRAQRQFSAVLAVVIFTVGLLVVGLELVAPTDYPTGDVRNELWFRLAFGAFLLGVGGAVLVGSLWRLRRKD